MPQKTYAVDGVDERVDAAVAHGEPVDGEEDDVDVPEAVEGGEDEDKGVERVPGKPA